ncbi:MAG: arginine deiminase family protein [Anaerolineales bacterium]|nr:arginine deiminase family protein [Anaerolineales bacterium]
MSPAALAITREVSPRFSECEITHIERTPIDLNNARAQHSQYINTLKQLGCDVLELPAEADLPDSVFVEDTAVILPHAAIITRPGADSRKPETESIIQALSPHIKLLHIREPATLDGGDVLVVGKHIFVGLSTRSNQDAINQLSEMLKNDGYSVTGVQMHDCLHLKSAVTRVDDNTLLINKNWLDTHHFEQYKLIEVDPSEPHAANCLPIGDVIIYPTSFPKTEGRLKARGYQIVNVNVDELAKAEGAVTCCSLILVCRAESTNG